MADIVIVALIAVFALTGFMRGFFKTAVSLFSWFVCILLAVFLARLVSDALLGIADPLIYNGDNFSFYKVIYNFLPESIKSVSMSEVRATVLLGGDSAKESVIQLIKSEGGTIVGLGANHIADTLMKPVFLESSLANVGQVIAVELAYGTYVVAVGITLFIVLRIIVVAVSIVVRFSGDQEVNIVNRITGAALGAVRGFLYTVVLFALLSSSMVAGLSFLTPVRNQVEQSKLAGPMGKFAADSIGKINNNNRQAEGIYQNIIDRVMADYDEPMPE